MLLPFNPSGGVSLQSLWTQYLQFMHQTLLDLAMCPDCYNTRVPRPIPNPIPTPMASSSRYMQSGPRMMPPGGVLYGPFPRPPLLLKYWSMPAVLFFIAAALIGLNAAALLSPVFFSAWVSVFPSGDTDRILQFHTRHDSQPDHNRRISPVLPRLPSSVSISGVPRSDRKPVHRRRIPCRRNNWRTRSITRDFHPTTVPMELSALFTCSISCTCLRECSLKTGVASHDC